MDAKYGLHVGLVLSRLMRTLFAVPNPVLSLDSDSSGSKWGALPWPTSGSLRNLMPQFVSCSHGGRGRVGGGFWPREGCMAASMQACMAVSADCAKRRPLGACSPSPPAASEVRMR